MTTYSIIPTVRSTLHTLLDAALTVTVSPAPPMATQEMEHVWIGGVDLGFHEIPVMTANRKRREETFGIDVFIDVVKEGNVEGGMAAEARAFVIYQQVEDTVANDPSLGLSATHPTFRWERTTFTGDIAVDEAMRGYRYRLKANLEFACRLS